MVGHGDAAYHSACASSGQVWADVIAQLVTARAADAQAEAERIAQRRVVGGVHYPSDLAGSRYVVRAVGVALAKSPKFQAALAEVRAELAATRWAKASFEAAFPVAHLWQPCHSQSSVCMTTRDALAARAPPS